MLGVRIEGAGRTFPGGVEAVRAVDLTVDPGAFVALLGPSGCGKTTLLRMIGGLEPCSTGRVRFDAPLDGAVGYCFQEPRLLPWRTALANVALPLALDITDIAAARPAPGYAHYCAAKAGLKMLTESMALELAPAVRVNAIAPGTVLPPETHSQAALEAIRATVPLGRLGTAQDIAKAAIYLALDAPYVTGQTLAVDGGRSIGGPLQAG